LENFDKKVIDDDVVEQQKKRPDFKIIASSDEKSC